MTSLPAAGQQAAERLRRSRFSGHVDRQLLADVLVPFVATRVLLVIAGVMSISMLHVASGAPLSWDIPHIPALLVPFTRWDVTRYAYISLQGYRAASWTTFFPLFPMLVRSAGAATGMTDLGGLATLSFLIANGALLAATAGLVLLARLDFDRPTASRAAWYLLVFPSSLFLSAGYADSIFLALSIGMFLAARRSRWLLAGLLAALAALDRPFGVLLVLPLALEAWWQRSQPGTWKALPAMVLAPLALGGYLAYLGSTFHDPLSFLHAESGWGRHLMAPWDTFTTYFSVAPTMGDAQHSIPDLLFTVFAIAVTVASWRLLRRSYALFLTALLLVPLSSGTLLSMPRFVVAWFPVFLVLAIAGRRPEVDRLFLVSGAVLSTVLMLLFAQWYWVA